MASELNLFERVKPVPIKNGMFDEKYNIWCGSVVKGDDGKYHMFYSRWKRELGHYAWVTDSEVAYAVSDTPIGPFTHVNVTLPRRGREYWDGTTTHNPYILRFEGKYYLYYMGTTGFSDIEYPTNMGVDNWWEYRNNQRIGVAVADNPEGPWERFDKPIMELGKDGEFDSLAYNNPAVTVRPDGGIILLYKGIIKNDTLRGGRVKYGIATADSPLGTYTKHSKTIFEKDDGNTHNMLVEDAFVAYYKDRYIAAVRDVIGMFTGESGGIAFFESFDGFDWKVAENPKVLGATVLYEDGHYSDDRPERPWLLIDGEKIVAIFAAIGINHREHSSNVAIPIE